MRYEDFIGRFPEVKKQGKYNMVRCPAHEDSTASLSIAKGRDGVVLKCFAGCSCKDVCAALEIRVRDLFFDAPDKEFKVKYKPLPAEKLEPEADEELVCSYSYTDAIGNEIYQALRYKKKDGKKTFRQRHGDGRGGWKWNMDGVERVLYNLPAVMKSNCVWCVEGEKDADNLIKEGICATTNVGGAKKWLDAYSEALKGKDVVICGDNDKPGQEHVEQVFESVSGKAKTVRVVRLPENVKDVSDFIADKNGTSKKILEELADGCVPHYAGIKMPLYTMAEIEPRYKRLVRETSNLRFDMGAWLPSLRRIRPIMPGEFVLFNADTAVGKTAVLQNIAFFAKYLKCLLFEMELPDELLFERFLAMHQKMKCSEIEQTYRTIDDTLGPEVLDIAFQNITICPESRLTPERLEQLILRSELKIGEKPQMVLVDYVQLMKGSGNKRYERASDVGESLKEIAKITKTIMIAVSQIARPEKTDGVFVPTLHSAKDSGSFENSAGVVIGLWRDESDPLRLNMKVLKSTKGGAGTEVVCNFDGETMRINERAKQVVEE